MFADLRHAMASLSVERQQQQPAGRATSTPAARAAAALTATAADTDTDGESISDVFDDVAEVDDVAPAGQPAGSSLLQQVARDIAALNSRNAALQHEIDGISVTSSSLPSPRLQPTAPATFARGAPPQQQQPQQFAGARNKQAATSHTLLPPTPDLSQT